MSFSMQVKEELAAGKTKRRHCQLAELAAMTSFLGRIFLGADGRCTLYIQTETAPTAKKYMLLLKKCFSVRADFFVRCCHTDLKSGKFAKGRIYGIYLRRHSDVCTLLAALHMLTPTGMPDPSDTLVSTQLIERDCCRRAFLRGAFLATGSMSDPHKFYHLEFVCDSAQKAMQLAALVNGYDLHAKTVRRKKQHVVYIKEGDQIATLLNLTEAHIALMDFENIRIEREIANKINRQTNCDVANSQKTVSASARQREDIELIRRTRGLSSLPPPLLEIASLRLEYPDSSIKELGEKTTPPVGKSGVNHRLRKLSQLANQIRGIE